MKLIKKVSAAVVSAALAATMAFSASAETTVDDVIQAAVDNGVQAHNVKQLEQFIFENADEFDDAERAEMVKAIQNSGLIVAKYTDKDLAELTEEERNTILKGMSDEDKKTILDNMVAMGAAVDVEITYEKSDTNFGYDVFATMKKTADGDGDGKEGDSKGGTIKIDTLPKTGDVNNVNTVAVVMASMAIILAGAGIVVVAKKNKEN